MTTETEPKRQNLFLQTLKRAVGIQGFQQVKEDYAKDSRLSKITNGVFVDIFQAAMPMSMEPVLSAGKGQENILTKNSDIMSFAFLLDLGIPLGAIIIALNVDIARPVIPIVTKIGYNLGVGVLNEVLEKKAARKNQSTKTSV